MASLLGITMVPANLPTPPDSYSTILFVQIGSNVASSLSGAMNVDDNGVATVAAFAPVPEPLVLSGLAALVAMGGSGSSGGGSASLPTEEIGPLPARKSVEGVYQAKASRPTASLLSFPVSTDCWQLAVAPPPIYRSDSMLGGCRNLHTATFLELPSIFQESQSARNLRISAGHLRRPNKTGDMSCEDNESLSHFPVAKPSLLRVGSGNRLNRDS